MAAIINLARYRRQQAKRRTRSLSAEGKTLASASANQRGALLELIEEWELRLLNAVSILPEGGAEQWAIELELKQWGDMAYLMQGGDPRASDREMADFLWEGRQ